MYSTHPGPPPPPFTLPSHLTRPGAFLWATKYSYAQIIPLPISEEEPPALPPRPHSYKFKPPNPDLLFREDPFKPGVTDPETIRYYTCLRSLSLKPAREWTIEELKVLYANDVDIVSVNHFYQIKISPDQIDMHLRILHRYFVLLEETDGFDIDVRPVLGGLDVCLTPMECSMEAHPESYHIFEELAQIVLSESEFAKENYHLKTVDRVNVSRSPLLQNVYITFQAVKGTQAHKVLDTEDKCTPAKIFRAVVEVDLLGKAITVKSCEVN